jgi:hypothetical protein
MTISAREIESAVPLPVAPPRVGRGRAATENRTRPPANPGFHPLAIASFVSGIAGIPLFGLLTGLVAVGLGTAALTSIRAYPRRGLGLALAGVLLGVVDVAGWIIVLSVFLFRPGPDLSFASQTPDMTVIAAMDRPLARAMRANVLIERSGGLAALGGKAIGSGVILELSGGSALIVTNRHVVDDDYPDSGLDVSDPLAVRQLGRVTVKLLGPAAGNGQVVWLAPGNVDLALVRSNVPPASQAQPARWRKGRTVKVGASVFAIGNPHNFGWSHTQGVVSQLRVQETKTAKIHVIQTQAAINPGNSGGGLYDQDGYLLGINSWGVDKSTSEGLNFAIALDDLLAAVPASILGREASDPDDGGHTRP